MADVECNICRVVGHPLADYEESASSLISKEKKAKIINHIAASDQPLIKPELFTLGESDTIRIVAQLRR